MKIIDGFRTLQGVKGQPIEIPNCGRDELPEFFKEFGLSVGVEIGVERGLYSKVLLDGGMKVYGVDPYRAYSGYNFPDPVRFQTKLDAIFADCQRRLSDHIQSGQFIPVRKSSMEALEDFADESLDFVYIDGNHGFRYVAEDLVEWTEKVKHGGFVCGHDFFPVWRNPRDAYACHVIQVVPAFVAAYRIPRWFLLGSKITEPGGHRDKFRSFLWQRP